MSVNSISSSRLSIESSKRVQVNKMKFTNYQLSYQVRKKVYELLITFDNNQNYEFEEEQIKKALVVLLKENKHQITYVTKNVFRYDKNHDGIITYEQFTNFCLEQHFGEMAIQRLHKNNFYAEGNKRIMSQDQFVKTLQYCFEFIGFSCQTEQLTQIFCDIDSKQQGFISYTDYFYFLKEYFGSQSESVEVVRVESVFEEMKRGEKIVQNFEKLEKKEDQKSTKSLLEKTQEPEHFFERKRGSENFSKSAAFKNIISRLGNQKNNNINAIKPTMNPQMKEMSFEEKKLCQRIARLVYHQLKVTAMNYDDKKLLKLNEFSTKQLINKHFKIPQQDASPIISHLSFKSTSDTISYESLLQEIVQTFMCKILPDKRQMNFPLTKTKFIDITKHNMQFINAKPHTYMLEEVFQLTVNPAVSMEKQQFVGLMNKIFKSYEWPRRTGQLRKAR